VVKRRIEQLIRFLGDGDKLGWSFARAALRPWKHKAPFAMDLGAPGSITVRGDSSDIDTVRNIFVKHDYQVPSAPARARLLARMEAITAQGKTPLIVDAGANIGAAAIWFAHEFPAATVLAVEPDPANHAMLLRNAEHRERIVPVEAAIGSTAGAVTIEEHGAADAARTVASETGVPMLTMDMLIDRVPDAVPFIAKIDIEGFEADLFASNTDWIDRFDAVMIELHDWMLPGAGSSVGVQREMGRREGYEVFLKGENLIYVRV
jgi:FkbM family methyltransferase